MILSVSRRTDIPKYYSDWFYHRIKEGYVYVRNPMNIHQIGKVSITSDVVDGIVFWTKDPTPMLERLDELDEYVYYFQFTLNSYEKDVEPCTPPQSEIVPIFRTLSERIGSDKVVWRYDPILFNEKYSVEYHTKNYGILVDKLAGYTEKCTISFLDFYKNTQRNTDMLKIMRPSAQKKEELVGRISEIAQNSGIYIDTCAEDIDLSKFGVRHAHCIEKERFERIGDFKLQVEKDKNQRPECGCIASIDIGAYNTCRNECLYCYANFNQSLVSRNFSMHDPFSPLLFGTTDESDIIKEREVRSCKKCQLNFLE